VIKGRVINQLGDPVSSATVMVLEQAIIRGRMRWRQAGSSATDDRGQYRIHSLPPGHYYAVAMRARTTEDLRAASVQPEKSVYVPTFFPGTTDRAMSIPIDIRGGEEAPLDIMLQRQETVPVRGRVVTRGSLVGRVGTVEFSQTGVALGAPSAAAIVDANSNFETRLVPGSYRASISISGVGGNATGRQLVQISHGGAGDLVLYVGMSTQLTVRARTRTSRRLVFGSIPSRVELLPVEDDEDVDSPRSRIAGAQDRFSRETFLFDSVPQGRYEVAASGPGEAFADSYVDSISPGSPDNIIEMNGAQRAQATVTVSLDGAQVLGTVFTPAGAPLGGAIVVAVPEQDRSGRTSLYKTTITDQLGKFVLHGLAPGGYTVLAWDDVDDGMWFDRRFIDNAANNGVPVTVRDNDRREIQLKAIITKPGE
jgi:hypothetical protein